MMKIRYDPDADAVYMKFGEDAVASTKEIDQYTILDLNATGEVIGVELLFVKERHPDFLNLHLENISVA